MDTRGVRDKNLSAVGAVAVLSKFCDGIQLSMLNFGAGDEFPVNFIFAAVVVSGRHSVPAERNN